MSDETPQPPAFDPGPGPYDPNNAPDARPDGNQRPEPVEGERGYRSGTLHAEPDQKGRLPDPGSRTAGWVTLLLLIPALAVVVFFQQRAVIAEAALAEERAQEIVPSGKADVFGLLSRFTVKFNHLLEEMGASESELAQFRGNYMDTIDEQAMSPHEEMRAAMIAGDMEGADAALLRLDETLEKVEAFEGALDAEYTEALRTDAALLRDIYTTEESAAGLSADERSLLIDHHGWHGRLALTYGKDDDDPERAELVKGGGMLAVGLGGFAIVVVLALIAGFVLLIVGIVLVGSRKLRFRFLPPAVGGSVYLETFAVFVGLFMLTQVASMLLPKSTPPALIFGLQWLVALSLFWPMVRGVGFERWKADMGFRAPRGVFREIWAGILVYLASVPLFLLAALLGLALVMVRQLLLHEPGGEESIVEAPLTNPIIELIESMDGLSLVVLGSLVMVWAPLVEEGIMRGALYRHLRSRMYAVFAAILSALLFGALHQYDVLMLLPVITLGAMFAFMREWRGSIIGCITAHTLHNSTIFLLIVWLVSAT